MPEIGGKPLGFPAQRVDEERWPEQESAVNPLIGQDEDNFNPNPDPKTSGFGLSHVPAPPMIEQAIYTNSSGVGSSNASALLMGAGGTIIQTTPDGIVEEGDRDEYGIIKGKRKFPSGRVDEGPFENNLLNGVGCTQILEDGRIRKGVFAEGIFIKGIQISFDSKRQQAIEQSLDAEDYYHEPRKKLFTGKGSFALPNGAKLIGEFKDGLLHGESCKQILEDGRIREGKFDLGNFIKGVETFPDSDGKIYRGSWQNGKPILETKKPFMGKGTFTLQDGRRLEGDFVDGLFVKGTRTYPTGEVDEGDFVNGLFVKGKRISSDGTVIQGDFVKGELRSGTANLGDLKFAGLLTGQLSSSYSSYNLGVLYDFLKQQNDPSNEALRSALEMELSLEDKAEIAGKILEKLSKPGSSQLLAYGTAGHAIGLNIRATEVGDFYFDLFNSGNGLSRHSRGALPPSNKVLFQTMLRIRIPGGQLSKEKLVEILNYKQFGSEINDIDKAYQAILSIPGATMVQADPFEAVWQSEQKSGNCALEWIFAYLRNTKGLHDYTRMRRKLYEAVSEATKEAESRMDANDLNRRVLLQGEYGPKNNLSTQEAYADVRNKLDTKLHKSLTLLGASPPDDLTGARQARIEKIKEAGQLALSEEANARREALHIFRQLVDRGEAISEATNVAQALSGDKDDGVRQAALRLLREVAHRSFVQYEMKHSRESSGGNSENPQTLYKYSNSYGIVGGTPAHGIKKKLWDGTLYVGATEFNQGLQGLVPADGMGVRFLLGGKRVQKGDFKEGRLFMGYEGEFKVGEKNEILEHGEGFFTHVNERTGKISRNSGRWANGKRVLK